MVSLTDPDARWGYKHKTMKFAGYKVHISEDESELVTTVQTLAGNEHEGAHLKDILDEDQRKEIPATVVTAGWLFPGMKVDSELFLGRQGFELTREA